MFTANDARKATNLHAEPVKKWNILDTIQLKHIERKIKFESAKGRRETVCNRIRPRVEEKLVENGYSISRGAAALPLGDGISWVNVRW